MDTSGFEWLDTDADGSGDQGFADTNGDGWYDTVLYDTNLDGVVDGAGQDVDANGVLDVLQSDTDRDGVIDTVGWDTDQDGALDQAAGPGSGGVVVPVAEPEDVSTAIMDATVVGPATYDGPQSLALDPRALADPVTREAVQRIADQQADTGSIWTQADPW
jgi:hypothetical protein